MPLSHPSLLASWFAPKWRLPGAAWLGVAVFASSILACSSSDALPDARKLRFNLEVINKYPAQTTPLDLDDDGEDELVNQIRLMQLEERVDGALILRTQSGNTIEQINFKGSVLTPRLLDVVGDAAPELLVPVVRNDSLFVTVTTSRGVKLFNFFVASGEPRQEPEGELRWDPLIVDFHVIDVNGDGRPELVTVFDTGYARRPRGVAVHSIPDGTLLGRVTVGAYLGATIVDDFDGDGKPDMLAGTLANNNGASAGGFDDDHSYLIEFGFDPIPKVTWWRETGGRSRHTQLVYDDFDQDGRRDVLAITGGWLGETRVGLDLELREPGTWRVIRSRSVTDPLTAPILVDLDRTSPPEILTVRPPGEVWVFDHNFDVVRRKSIGILNLPLATVPDIDGDGIDEIIAHLPNGGFVMLDPKLRVLARYPTGIVAGILRRGFGAPPALLIREAGTGALLSAQLVNNPWYLVYRFGPGALWLSLVTVPSIVGWMVHRLRRQNKLLSAVHRSQLDAAPIGMFLLDSKGGVPWINRTAVAWLEAAEPPRDVEGLERTTPSVAAFCRDVMRLDSVRSHEANLILALDGQRERIRAVAQPMFAGLPRDPHWCVRLDPTNQIDQSAAWPLMARRVAHSVKNPLTSMLLTLQRLQIEYRERAPAIANRLDRYASRIEDRIGQLRQLTSNFLKFVNIEEPNLVDAELAAVVESFTTDLRRSLPPDIQLVLRLQPGLPAVRLDPEQMHALLDNLVANAVNAMPEGGVITIATSLAVSPSGNGTVAERVLLEVLDTGGGIDREITTRIFEPGFTTAEEGSGLGLAIVKKIVADHGGTVTVESEVGNGSVFSVYLPLASHTLRSAARVIEARRSDASAARIEGERHK